jgi:hypothetical protein
MKYGVVKWTDSDSGIIGNPSQPASQPVTNDVIDFKLSR